MKAIDNMLAQIRHIDKNLEAEAVHIVEAKSESISEIVRGQLLKGLDGSGKAIKPKYSPETIRSKKKKGQPTNKVTLFDSGDFHNSFFTQAKGQFYSIFSKDHKAPFLFENYGENILTPTKENNSKVNLKIVLPGLREYILTNLKF